MKRKKIVGSMDGTRQRIMKKCRELNGEVKI